MKTIAKEKREEVLPQKKITGAEALIKALQHEQTEIIFGYPGGAIMPVYDALLREGENLRHVLVRHEQGAVHAAQGYARAKRTTGVCLVTSGPGATNLLTGLADARIDSTPLVCICGQVNSRLLGTEAFQEIDIISMALPVTKWSVQITRACDIMPMLAKAFYLARSGRPGPVLVDITKDAQMDFCDDTYSACTEVPHYFPKPVPDHLALKAAIDLLNKAERPLIVAGQGVLLSDAKDELLRLAEKAQVPVALTLLGLSAFSYAHPLYAGMLGMHGNYASNIMTNECDVLLAVGMRFDDRVTGDLSRYAKQAKVIHVDIDAAEIGKNVTPAVALHADAREALHHIVAGVSTTHRSAWLHRMQALKSKEEINLRKTDGPLSGITMAEVVRELGNLTKGNAVLVTDVGQHQMIASRYYPFASETADNITSGGLGTMGFALPAALGAKLARPDKSVVAIVGDGGIQMTIQELATIAQENVPVKIIILNNNYLGMVRQWQELFFEKRYSSVEMQNPDFVSLAKAFGIAADRTDDKTDLKSALRKLLDSEVPQLLEVLVLREENVFPMIEPGKSISEIRLK